MKQIVLGGPAAKVLTAAAVIAVFCAVVYLISGLPAPREEDRVSAPGIEFSIIKPRDWTDTVEYHLPPEPYAVAIQVMPPKVVGRGESMFAARLNAPPDIEKLKSTGSVAQTFQGLPALVRGGMGKHEFAWSLLFERSGAWYEITLHLPRPEADVTQSEWWPYIQSFKLSGPPIVAPTTNRG